MKQIPIESKLLAAFIVVIGILMFIFWIGYQQSKEQIEANNLVDHTHQVLESLDAIALLNYQAGTGQLVGLITHDEESISYGLKSRANLLEKLDSFLLLTSDIPEQQKLGNELSKLIVKRNKVLDLCAKAYLSGGIRAYARALRDNDATEISKKIGQILATGKSIELKLLDQRKKTVAQSDLFETWFLVILAMSLILLLSSLFYRIRMEIISRTNTNLQLERAILEADAANQAKSEFLSSMSHELRTPMNAIIGFGELMQFDDSFPEEYRDYLHEILKAGQHLLQLINEVLDLARIESGHVDLSLEPVDVYVLINECEILESPMARSHGITLSHKGLEILEGLAVRADRTRLKQALLNLVSNAIKYNRDGGSVTINVQPAGSERLRIRVSDTGNGIPADRMKELFQPFNRLDAENSEIEGTGIGLTITRRLVEMMGGNVDAESQVGVGSTFWIELPLGIMPVAEQEHTQAAVSFITQAEEVVTGSTVLYIEDNPSNLKLVSAILGQRKHIRLLTAHTAELGIELAMAHQPGLILLDINMPGLNGYQTLEILKADSRTRDIPVLAITANAMLRDIERGRKAGFTNYLTKPLNTKIFLQVVEEALAA